MQPSGQSIVDRFLAAKNTIAGQAVNKIVCKATTEEIMGPKRKHLDCLLQATHEMNVSIPELADLLIERSQNSSWIVSFKSLITIHHLISYGNERFEAYMASHNHLLQSTVSIDRSGIMSGSDMTVYLRRYAAYLNERREAYKLMGYDFCKIKRGKDQGFFRTMPTDKLLKALPILQKQLDALLNFDVAPNELINGVINSCFFLLIKDLVHLYTAFNDGIINLLEKYFTMNKKQCREALDIYKKFIDRTDKVAQYLKIAETSGMEQNAISDLVQAVESNKAPNSLVESLENHLTYIEGKKMSSQSLVSKNPIEQDMKNFSRDFPVNGNIDPQKVLEEEAKALAQFNKKKEVSSPPPLVSTQSAATTNGNGFGGTDFFSQPSSTNGNGFGSTDFFSQLSSTNGNAFGTTDFFSQPSSTNGNGFGTTDFFSQPSSTNGNGFGGTHFFSQHSPTNEHPQSVFSDDIFSLAPSSSQTVTNTFSAFDNVLDTTVPKQNFFEDILQPTSTNPTTSTVPLFTTNQNVPLVTKPPLQSGDLNSSLTQLIDNLGIKDHSKIGKDHQWTPSDNKGQQKLSTSTGTMNTPGTTWPNPAAMNTPFGGAMNIQTGSMWQPPPVSSMNNNPFAVPTNGPSQMNFIGISNQPTNPFAAEPSYGASLFNQQQVNDPFGNL